ncbi:hypothetical protein J421_3997 [Gemmatirosa kalamazoonensis]|uniref:Uncharacterized protein n=1 Tax=Gemmatirosa kalamazoonensis TaxID=861299 RepID=W0RKA8_9BACT|nr:hypothetical protein [Gemmatirosa kalamazoonensis]AHG91534.1 hypothetical protein J421_3997 [Gemmatirosa kalamazoonensis]
MTDPLPTLLASRFRDDAQALRARASVLQSRGGTQAHGPSADACRQMADACDRVSALLGAAADATALRAAVPELERLLAAERSPDVRNVYGGAVTRVRQALGAADEDDEDDDDLEDELDDEDDDE